MAVAFDFAKLREGFLDSPKVMAAADKAKRRVFSKLGAFVRRRAKSSIRKRKASALPGQPPSSHVGTLRMIFFSWDDATRSVVVGPILTPGSTGAPALLEFGGDISRRDEDGKPRQLHYRGNPFMTPALEAERPKFASQFKDQVR